MVKSIFPSDSDDGRFCPDCAEFKPLAEFYASGPDKLHRYCITHYSARKKVRYEAKREKYIAKTRDWQSRNPDKVKAIQKRHKDKPAVKQRQKELEQQPHVKATRHEYDLTHRKESKYYNSRWKRENKDKVNAAGHNRRAKAKNNGGEHTDREWRALMARYGWHCISCGSLDPLCFEHINPIELGGGSEIANGQPSCIPCNTSKGQKFDDWRSRPDGGLLYDTRPDLPIGEVDITMGDLPVPDHARHPGRIDTSGRTEKLCTYHKCLEPIANFRTKAKNRNWLYPECKEAEAIGNRKRRAKQNPDYKARPAVAHPIKAPVIKVATGFKLCRGPKHSPEGEVLPLDKFPTRRAASGNMVPKSYCRKCLIELQRLARDTKNGLK